MKSLDEHREWADLGESLGLVGKSEAFEQILEIVKQVAPTGITVLIAGESGTGKEMVAHAVHRLSPRKDKPMLTVNCGAIPEGILESELFGHEKGSFTGAQDMRRGYFEIADGGTLFLDEIGELPPATQVKLLRVLEGREFMRVGGDKTLRVDVRVIAATNRDLEAAVRRGEFRKDLFYRLNAVKIFVPPLRDRKEDIRELVIHFAEEVSKANKIRFLGFTDDAFDILENYSWPGNVRELKNLVERVLILGKGQTVDRSVLESQIREPVEVDRNLPILLHKTSEQAERELIYRALLDIRMALEDLRRIVVTGIPRQIPVHPAAGASWSGGDSRPESEITLDEMEKNLIEKTLAQFRGNRKKTAKALGIGERTLYRKLKEYGIDR
jgi:DNA-binding NtrC family response regulator